MKPSAGQRATSATASLLWGVGLTVAAHGSLFGVVAAVGPPTPELRARPPVRIRLITPEPPKPPPPPQKSPEPEPPKVAVAKPPEPEAPRPRKKVEPNPAKRPDSAPEPAPPPSASPPPPPTATMPNLPPAPGPGTTGIAIPVAPTPPPQPPKPPAPPSKPRTYAVDIGDGTGDGQGDGSGGGGNGDGKDTGGKAPAKPADEKPQRGRPVDPATVTKLPGLLRKPGDDELRAAYPEAARQRGLDGNVGLEILIDEEGRVTNARVTRPGGNGFDEVALKFIRRHRFRPATKNGQPVTVWIPWLYKFRIGD